jgi:predicted NBD/HSP70 family sugar kinase
MPGWDRYPIIETVQQWFPYANVVIDNDVNVIALGEVSLGAARGVSNLIAVKIGTGIGAGIICDGHIYRGSSGCAGDIGHICVDKEAGVRLRQQGLPRRSPADGHRGERYWVRSGRSPVLLARYQRNGDFLRTEDGGRGPGR